MKWAILITFACSTNGLDDHYYAIEVDRKIIQCKMCPAGQHWIKHCSRDGGQAVCQDCPDGRFIMDFNRAIFCKRCSECKGTQKESGEVVADACTRFHDTKCVCKTGYWREKGMVGDCRKVSPCMPGYGVEELANSFKNTTCERCVNGKTFSNISSEVTPCQNCSVCLEGWVQKTTCNGTEDTVCIPKDEEETNIVTIMLFGLSWGGVLLAVVIIISYRIRRNINLFRQNWCICWRHRQGNQNDVEQTNQLQHVGKTE